MKPTTINSATGPKDWPEDASHENGGYQNNCCNCQQVFYGHKRRVFCRECCELQSATGDCGVKVRPDRDDQQRDPNRFMA